MSGFLLKMSVRTGLSFQCNYSRLISSQRNFVLHWSFAVLLLISNLCPVLWRNWLSVELQFCACRIVFDNLATYCLCILCSYISTRLGRQFLCEGNPKRFLSETVLLPRTSFLKGFFYSKIN